MKRIRVELSNERLITPRGLALVGAVLGKSDLLKRSNRMASITFYKVPIFINFSYFNRDEGPILYAPIAYRIIPMIVRGPNTLQPRSYFIHSIATVLAIPFLLPPCRRSGTDHSYSFTSACVHNEENMTAYSTEEIVAVFGI